MNGVANSGLMEIPAATKIFAVSNGRRALARLRSLGLVRARLRFPDGVERIPTNAVAEKNEDAA